MTAELTQVAAALTAQWTRLRAWLEPLGDDLLRTRDTPSSCAGWTNGELVVHLGRAMEALAVCTPAPTGTAPLTLAEYLGTYPDRAQDIADTTRELAVELAEEPLAGVTDRATRALTRLAELGDDGTLVVQARRGPVTLRDMAVSRLIELVVHAQDLADSLGSVTATTGDRSPVDRTALGIVAEELLRIVVIRGGGDLELRDAALWTRLATGRARYDVDELARALAPAYTAGSVPDLGRMLPLL